ncbi:MAG: LysR family transcriptional regulator [Pseudomonadota bacterium]
MDLRDLRIFQRIADLGSLHSAAESLDLTQPALSKSLRRLETSLGVRLFERTARGVALTSIGKVLYARNAGLLQVADEIPRELNDLKTGKADQLRVGTVPGLVDHVLCPALAESMRTGVPSNFSVHIQLTGALLRELGAGHLDFALTSLPENVPPELTYAVLGEQRAHVVGRADHPLRKRRFEPLELMGYPWILPSSAASPHNWAGMVFESLGLPLPEAFIKTDSSSIALASLIANSDALTVMTADSLASRGGVGLKALPPPAGHCTQQVALCWRRGAYASASMRQFRAHLAKAFAERPTRG